MPLKSKTGSVIVDQGVQLERWVEHYLELYATQDIVTDLALVDILDLPIMVEIDATPTKEEIQKVIDCLASGKAPRSDGIPTEVLKSGKSTLLQHLHDLLCLCWKQGYIPQDMRDPCIVTLYKSTSKLFLTEIFYAMSHDDDRI